MRVAEVHLHVGSDGEVPVGDHFTAAVPSKRAAQLRGELANLLGEGLGYGPGVFAVDFDQHHIAGAAFDQCGDLRACPTHEQVALPMPRNGPILDLCRPLMDRDPIDHAPLAAHLRARSAHESTAPEVPEELLLQDVTRLQEQAAVDGLVGDAHRAIMREGALQANGNLARRPVALQVLGHPVSQTWPACQQACLRPASTLPGVCLGQRRPIAAPAPVTADLAAHRRRSSAKPPGDLVHPKIGRQAPRDLFALSRLQRSRSATAGSWFEPAVAS